MLDVAVIGEELLIRRCVEGPVTKVEPVYFASISDN
jgi:hypothetical protein